MKKVKESFQQKAATTEKVFTLGWEVEKLAVYCKNGKSLKGWWKQAFPTHLVITLPVSSFPVDKASTSCCTLLLHASTPLENSGTWAQKRVWDVVKENWKGKMKWSGQEGEILSAVLKVNTNALWSRSKCWPPLILLFISPSSFPPFPHSVLPFYMYFPSDFFSYPAVCFISFPVLTLFTFLHHHHSLSPLPLPQFSLSPGHFFLLHAFLPSSPLFSPFLLSWVVWGMVHAPAISSIYLKPFSLPLSCVWGIVYIQ